MLRRAVLLAAAVHSLGCAAAAPDRAVPVRIQPVVTAHDAAATRIWVIENAGPLDHVVLCDTALLARVHALCVRTPIVPVPGTMPVTVVPPPTVPPSTPSTAAPQPPEPTPSPPSTQ